MTGGAVDVPVVALGHRAVRSLLIGLVAGPLVVWLGIGGIAIIGALLAAVALVSPRSTGIGGLLVGLAGGVSASVAYLSSNCGAGCIGPDLSAYLFGSAIAFVIGAPLLGIEFMSRRLRDAARGRSR